MRREVIACRNKYVTRVVDRFGHSLPAIVRPWPRGKDRTVKMFNGILPDAPPVPPGRAQKGSFPLEPLYRSPDCRPLAAREMQSAESAVGYLIAKDGQQDPRTRSVISAASFSVRHVLSARRISSRSRSMSSPMGVSSVNLGFCFDISLTSS